MKCKSNKHSFVLKTIDFIYPGIKYNVCEYCGYYKSPKNSDFTPHGLSMIIKSRERFLKEMEERRVLIEVRKFENTEEYHRKMLANKFRYNYKITDYGQFC